MIYGVMSCYTTGKDIETMHMGLTFGSVFRRADFHSDFGFPMIQLPGLITANGSRGDLCINPNMHRNSIALDKTFICFLAVGLIGLVLSTWSWLLHSYSEVTSEFDDLACDNYYGDWAQHIWCTPQPIWLVGLNMRFLFPITSLLVWQWLNNRRPNNLG